MSEFEIIIGKRFFLFALQLCSATQNAVASITMPNVKYVIYFRLLMLRSQKHFVSLFSKLPLFSYTSRFQKPLSLVFARSSLLITNQFSYTWIYKLVPWLQFRKR